MKGSGPKCLNCQTALVGRYCFFCGQDSFGLDIGKLSLADFLEKLVGLDKRSLYSFKSIMLKPGQLAVDYVEGRRQVHYSPVKIYFFVSVAFFFLIRLSSGLNIEIRWYGLFIDTLTSPELYLKSTTGINWLDNWVLMLSQLPAQSLNKIIYGGILAHAAQAMFLLLPVSAGILKGLYPKFKFNEHLMLSLNLLIFYQIVLSISALPIHSLIFDIAIMAINFVAFTYTWSSFRRFYKVTKLTGLIKAFVYLAFVVLFLEISMLTSLWISFSHA